MSFGLITGASGGIGRELALIHASKGKNVLLVSRNNENLLDLANEIEHNFKVTALLFACDLSKDKAVASLINYIEQNGLKIDYLFNNAGFGGHGFFVERDLKKDLEMLNLNVRSVMELCHYFIPKMIESGGGKILNVASTAGFVPGPLQASYFASKAFVVSFSQALHQENKAFNVSVTALCPGPVKTNFAETANMKDARMFKNAKDAAKVAKIAYRGMMNSKLIVFDDWKLAFALNWIIPLLPRRFVLKTVMRMQSQ